MLTRLTIELSVGGANASSVVGKYFLISPFTGPPRLFQVKGSKGDARINSPRITCPSFANVFHPPTFVQSFLRRRRREISNFYRTRRGSPWRRSRQLTAEEPIVTAERQRHPPVVAIRSIPLWCQLFGRLSSAWQTHFVRSIDAKTALVSIWGGKPTKGTGSDLFFQMSCLTSTYILHDRHKAYWWQPIQIFTIHTTTPKKIERQGKREEK